jgi:CBS domain-containing protein
MGEIQRTIADFIEARPVPAVRSSDPVARALAVMKERPCDAVAVIDEERVVGIFTERDFLNRVAAMRLSAAGTSVSQVMTPQPFTLHRDDCISYAINRMALRGFRNIPIVDDDGKALALLNVRDVVGHLSELFDELDDPSRSERWDEWNDIGGGA